MKLRQLLYLTVVSAAFVAAASTAQAAFPAIGNDTTGPGLTLTLGTGGAVTITTSGQGPYDGSDDTYVGVVNNSGASVSALHLASVSTPIFGFDGDGIVSFGISGNVKDSTGYGGPNAFFTAIAGNFLSGDVNFIVPIPNGGTDFFALEEPLDTATFGNGGGVTIGGGVPEPSIWATLLIGFAGLGYVTRRRNRVRGALA